MPYLVDFFIEHKLEQGAKMELFSILAEHFTKHLKMILIQAASHPENLPAPK